jgi:outer membrane protein
MKRRIITAAWLLAWTATTAVWAQKQWTLQECIDYAMQNNITLQKARLQTEQTEEDVKAAKAALLPSLSASTNHSLSYSPWQNSNITTVTYGTVDTKMSKSYYNGSYGINAQWTLWNGNRNRNTVKQNRLTAEQTELESQTTANSIQEQIAQLYVQILYLSEAVKVNEQSLETSRKNEERGQQMLEVGKMSKADLAQLTAQRAADEYAIVEARTNIAKCKLELKQLLELDAKTLFDVATADATDEMALADIPVLQTVYEQALAVRPEIKSHELQVKNSEISVKIAQAGYMPTLNLTGSLGTSTNSRSSDEWGSQMKTNFDMTGGLSLNIPLFDQRQTKTAVRKARLQKEMAQLDRVMAQDDLYRTIEDYWLDAENNQQKFRAAMITAESEQQSYDLLQEQFRLGLKNIVELLQGKDKLLTAQQNKLQSKYQTILALQMLRFYQGHSLQN